MGNKGGDRKGLKWRETTRERDRGGSLRSLWRNKKRHYPFNAWLNIAACEICGRHTYIHIAYISPSLSHSSPLFLCYCPHLSFIPCKAFLTETVLYCIIHGRPGHSEEYTDYIIRNKNGKEGTTLWPGSTAFSIQHLLIVKASCRLPHTLMKVQPNFRIYSIHTSE